MEAFDDVLKTCALLFFASMLCSAMLFYNLVCYALLIFDMLYVVILGYALPLPCPFRKIFSGPRAMELRLDMC